ncbi:hypothetical protein SERLADRAFT_405528 [Serpula lacrymans var. lacrymans S7.9]|uniref:Uncharacterized protein n=1 Tax=Serpula lacrymans var. lacrymans (strain S7.9) TaxID=578457 RepID=F8NJ96_SERL9|nr:uncharacterized protein SERLADRAFT_405528 [Serpula lacrymans var. lacrymans S7.9]EGO29580.1 hypothetical protein SERLADRAFT_405528 [Serpula lacrymans var. lacrymans S7.9]
MLLRSIKEAASLLQASPTKHSHSSDSSTTAHRISSTAPTPSPPPIAQQRSTTSDLSSPPGTPSPLPPLARQTATGISKKCVIESEVSPTEDEFVSFSALELAAFDEVDREYNDKNKPPPTLGVNSAGGFTADQQGAAQPPILKSPFELFNCTSKSLAPSSQSPHASHQNAAIGTPPRTKIHVSGRMANAIREKIVEDLQQVDKLIRKIAEQNGIEIQQVVTLYNSKNSRQGVAPNLWGTYQMYFQENAEQECKHLVPEGSNIVVDHFTNHMSLCYRDKTVGTCKHIFTKSVQKIVDSLQSIETLYGFQSVLVMCGNNVNHDEGLGSSFESCEAEGNVVMQAMRQLVISKVLFKNMYLQGLLVNTGLQM